MKALMLTRYSRLGASSRLRSLQYMPALRAAGMSVQVQALFDDSYLQALYERGSTAWTRVLAGYAARIGALLQARRYDLLIVEKELFPWLPAFAETLLRRLSVPLLVDYDDAIFHHYDLANNPWKRLLAGKIDRVMRSAEVVICGNDYLANRAAAAGAGRIVRIPTSVDLERYPVLPPEPTPICRIGWIGTPRTVHYLQALTPALQQAAARVPLQLVVVGANFAAPGLDVQCRPWSEQDEAAEIRSFDIGIMPLPDQPWERGKCAYKLIQAMACARPVVGSRVGANCSVVQHGFNGYLASSADEWQQAIVSLATDLQARRAMGLAGRRTVEEAYSLQGNAPLYAQTCLRAARRMASTGNVARPAGRHQWRHTENEDCDF